MQIITDNTIMDLGDIVYFIRPTRINFNKNKQYGLYTTSDKLIITSIYEVHAGHEENEYSIDVFDLLDEENNLITSIPKNEVSLKPNDHMQAILNDLPAVVWIMVIILIIHCLL